MPRPTYTARNRLIAKALYVENKSATALAREYGLSRSQVYRVADKQLQADSFAETRSGDIQSVAGGGLFSEQATTGLRRFGGNIQEEYDRVFRSLYRRVQLYKEMRDDPIVAAVENAWRMTLRRIGWRVDPGGDEDADQRAAEWFQTCMEDMSQSWSDTIDQALAMMIWGFQIAELVYKRRQGPKREGGSKYDDNTIGWRKWVFIAPDSLAQGNEWIFDEHGGLQGFNQFDTYTMGNLVPISIEKSILFRTTSERNNPEGRSLYRAMYRPFYYKNNVEELEAISAERMGAGFPVFYLGSDTARQGNSGDDLDTFKNIGTSIRVDEQMCLVIPYAKMGGGAREGEGVLFEFTSPPSKGIVDFQQVITRHEQRIAMVGLAQFIHLGMNQVGARALGESSTDFFTQAVASWGDMIAETIQRYAVDRLMALNSFPGLTANPIIAHESVTQADLITTAQYINHMVGAQLLHPSEELERHILELADLPISPKVAEFWEKKNVEDKVSLAGLPPTEPVPDTDAPEVVEGQAPQNGRELESANPKGRASFSFRKKPEKFIRGSGPGASPNTDAPDVAQEEILETGESFGSEDQPRDERGRWGSGGKGGNSGTSEGVGDSGIAKDKVTDYAKALLIKTRSKTGSAQNVIQASHGKSVLEASGRLGEYVNRLESAARDDGMTDPDINDIAKGFQAHDIQLGESFAQRGSGKPGARSKSVKAVNAYQADLVRTYETWAAEASDQLADADEDEREDLLDELIAALILSLKTLGRNKLPEAIAFGSGDGTPSARMYAQLAQALEEGDSYLDNTLAVDLTRKVKDGFFNPDILAALAAGEGAKAIGGLLSIFVGRLSSSAGEWWKLFNRSTGETIAESGGKVVAILDPDAKHCSECPQFHTERGKVYDSWDDYLAATSGRVPGQFECGNNCRCTIEPFEE